MDRSVLFRNSCDHRTWHTRWQYLTVADPYAAVRIDAAIARHALPPGRLVSGLVYDVSTGLIEIVDPATGQ